MPSIWDNLLSWRGFPKKVVSQILPSQRGVQSVIQGIMAASISNSIQTVPPPLPTNTSATNSLDPTPTPLRPTTSPRLSLVPNEILIRIIQGLLPPAIPFTIIKKTSVRNPRDLLGPLKASHHDVYRSLFVCKQWYLAGKSVLYAQPHIFSISQLHEFVSALEADESITTVVRRLFILDFVWVRTSRSDHQIRRCRKAIKQILLLCGCIDDIHLHLSSRAPNRSILSYHEALQAGSIGSCLRRLTLFNYDLGGDITLPHGFTRRVRIFGSNPPNLEFPNLVTLCLREVVIPSSQHFLPFKAPRLHTLIIADSNPWPTHHGSQEILIERQHFTSLKILKLYRNACAITIEPACAQNLLRLHVFDTVTYYTELLAAARMVHLQKIQHLTIGGFWPRSMYGSIDSFRFPPTLQSLRIIFQVDDDNARTEIRSSDLLEDIYHCFQASPMPSCQGVILHLIDWLPGKMQTEHVRYIRQQMRDVCVSRGIDFELVDEKEEEISWSIDQERFALL
ncbi:hypothetical protein C8Q75DRAFT_729932 [Abortiporus biennis]|nr:hypothetical protein C8Q75DRAFT_729932 [Abortiporus biennis]